MRINRSLDNFKGVILVSDGSKELEVWVDTLLDSEWNIFRMTEASSVLSRTLFVIKHMECPLFCVSKLKNKHHWVPLNPSTLCNHILFERPLCWCNYWKTFIVLLKLKSSCQIVRWIFPCLMKIGTSSWPSFLKYTPMRSMSVLNSIIHTEKW